MNTASAHKTTVRQCDRCGESIGAERLEALPNAVTCIRCASRHKSPARSRS